MLYVFRCSEISIQLINDFTHVTLLFSNFVSIKNDYWLAYRLLGHTEQKDKTKAATTASSPKKFLVTQSAILKMLSEAVKSYPGVAEFIIDQTVLNKDSEVKLTF